MNPLMLISEIFTISVIQFLLNQYIGENTITLGRCGSETYITFGKEILSRETNIKIAPVCMESINSLANNKQVHENDSINPVPQQPICGGQPLIKMISHSTSQKLQITDGN